MNDNYKFKIGDHVRHMSEGTHTIWTIAGYGPKGYNVKEHFQPNRILYEYEDEWEIV